MEPFTYQGAKTKEISFPLGGIGSGCIGLSGSGRLIDWEIFNRPAKGKDNGYTFFAVKAESDGKIRDIRVLNGPLQPPYMGGRGTRQYGFGPDRSTLAGVPHFQDSIFRGEYPIADMDFIHPGFPGKVSMTAFNPFIPLNDRDSSIPGAFFEFQVENTTGETLDYTLCLSVTNPLPQGNSLNTYCRKEGLHLLHLHSTGMDAAAVEYGDLTAATDAEKISYQQYWYGSGGFDSLEVFWHDFTTPGPFQNRTGSESSFPGNNTGLLAAHITLSPGECRPVRFILTWNFPNCHNYWNPEKSDCDCSPGSGCCAPEKPRTWKNYYATLFTDSRASAVYGLKDWDRLYEETLSFKEALFSSTLPPAALDAVSANISILKTPTCLRLPDGSFYAFEGCACDTGCCEGSCTHVWNYAYALPFLFPNLERSMRDLEFKYCLREDGKLSFRLMLPIGRSASEFRACADGQFGAILKMYREWKISGDTGWLKSHWPAMKKAIAFAWAPTNEDLWDEDRYGVLEGRQHHTLDMELFGPNSWLTGFYLAALKAGAEMAEVLGDSEAAAEYSKLFEKGKAWVDTHLFNGEYYYQKVDLTDKSLLKKYDSGVDMFGNSALQSYWNEEAGEIKYQIGEGCGIDQVLAQWHANLIGLGEVLDRQQVRTALQSIYKFNFINPIGEFFNPCRLYALEDEAGLAICTWPEGKQRPMVSILYSGETMNGFEYQAAIHMIQEGYVREGMEAVEAIRRRYDGERRNPWNEFECGSNYARSMASYALLLTCSGFKYHMAQGMVGFDPITPSGEPFQCFWSLDSGWGVFERSPEQVELDVRYGSLEVQTLELPFLAGEDISGIHLDGEVLSYTRDGSAICFDSPVAIQKGQSLVITR